MTKMKSKKMTKSTFAIIIMAIVMVAMIAFGGTYAFFTAQVNAQTGTATTGRVQLNPLSADGNAITLATKVVPGETLDVSGLKVTPNSNVKTFVFMKYSTSFAQDETLKTQNKYVSGNPTDTKTAEPALEGEYRLLADVADGWASFELSDKSVVYYAVVAADSTTALQVFDSLTFQGVSESNGDKVGSLMDGTLTVTFDASSIQYKGFENKTEEGFATTASYATLAEAAEAAYGEVTIKA